MYWQTFTKGWLGNLGLYSGEILSSFCHSVPPLIQLSIASHCLLQIL